MKLRTPARTTGINFLITKNNHIMIKTTVNSTPVINLDGPEGNAFVLMGKATWLCKSLGLNREEVVTEMTSGDYLHLLRTFEKYFGDYVILETENPEYLNLNS